MTSTARELRAQLRQWRRGRAGMGPLQLLEQLYVALLAVAVLGSMSLSAVLHAGRLAAHCDTAGCLGARTATPYLVALGWGWLALGVVGLLGPLVISTASSSWLFSTPVDRAALLRPQFAGGLTLSLLAGAAAPAGIGLLCGWPVLPAILLGLLTGLLSTSGYAIGAINQAHHGTPAVLRRWIAATLAATLIAGMLSVAVGWQSDAVPLGKWAGVVAATAALLVSVAAGLAAHRRLEAMDRRTLDSGAGLASGLAGALAGLDLALAYDVVMTRMAQAQHPSKRSRLRGRGVWTLAWADLARLRRAPGRLALLLAVTPLPYALHRLDIGAFVVPLTMLGLLTTGLVLLPGLRTVATAPALARALGARDAALRLGALLVPASALLLLGLTATAAMPHSDALIALAVGLGATAGSVRWVTGRPPDYGRPLVSTPAGGVPTNLYGSLFRGVDIVALVSVPLLLSPTPVAAAISLALSATVLGYLLTRP